MTYFGLTKKLVEFRRNYFITNKMQSEFHFSSQSKSLTNNISVQMRRLKTPTHHQKRNMESEQSSGDSSPSMTTDETQGSFTPLKVQQMVVDTQQYYILNVDARRTDRNQKIDEDWEGQKQIIILDFDQVMSLRKLENYFNELCKDKVFIKFKTFKLAAFEGKLAIILTLREDKAAKFLYFNLATMINKHKKALGENIKIGQLRQMSKPKHIYQDKVQIAISLVPYLCTREHIIQQIKDYRVYMDELFQYKKHKYGLIKIESLDHVEKIKTILKEYTIIHNHSRYFVSKAFIDAKVNIITKQKSSRSYHPPHNIFKLQEHIGCVSPSDYVQMQILEDGEISNNFSEEFEIGVKLNSNQINLTYQPYVKPQQLTYKPANLFQQQ